MAVSLTGAALVIPGTSYAATCYTGCHTTTPKTAGGTPTLLSSQVVPAKPTAQAQALAFTGANIIVPTGIGAGAIIIGGGLVLAGRRRRLGTAA